MAGGGERKIGHNKGKPSNVAYKAQGRADRNKRLRAARREKIEALHLQKRDSVAIKRTQGAVRRLEKRINILNVGETRTKLEVSLAKANRRLADQLLSVV